MAPLIQFHLLSVVGETHRGTSRVMEAMGLRRGVSLAAHTVSFLLSSLLTTIIVALLLFATQIFVVVSPALIFFSLFLFAVCLSCVSYWQSLRWSCILQANEQLSIATMYIYTTGCFKFFFFLFCFLSCFLFSFRCYLCSNIWLPVDRGSCIWLFLRFKFLLFSLRFCSR